MLQARGGADLSEKAFAAEDRAEVWVEHLHGDATVVLDVVRQIDGRHPAAADLAVDAIAVGESGGKTIDHARGAGKDGRRLRREYTESERLCANGPEPPPAGNQSRPRPSSGFARGS